ncbi:MAG TPA: ATP-binding protein, partial [Bacillales bacterium]|nr:ATP-binding protein [Bacillales bacterium]
FSNDHDNKNISIEYRGPKLFIKSKMAVSIALIINELIQNCVKHAFTTIGEGKINVIIQENGHMVKVQVSDNGIGCSTPITLSLGLEIVKMMVEHDLSGHFCIQGTSKGTNAFVEFPLIREE